MRAKLIASVVEKRQELKPFVGLACHCYCLNTKSAAMFFNGCGGLCDLLSMNIRECRCLFLIGLDLALFTNALGGQALRPCLRNSEDPNLLPIRAYPYVCRSPEAST